MRKFEFGELNPNIVARKGPELDPGRFSAYHVQQKVLEDYLTPQGFKFIQGWLRGVVLRVEEPSGTSAFGSYLGADDVNKQPLVRIKVRIPEIHPFPDPEIYGPEGDDSVISLYPTFVAVNADLPTPAVGEIVYVDYADRDNQEDPRYYGPVYKIPIFGGVSLTKPIKKIASLFDGIPSKLSDHMLPPTNESNLPTPLNFDSPEQSFNDIIHIVTNLSQGDSRWGSEPLGFGDSFIAGAGCLLTALTVATNTLNGTKLTPKVTNRIVQDANGFDGSNISVPVAAKALKLSAPVDKKIIRGTIEEMKARVDETLENGGLAIMHVDFTGDTQGDHFILIHSRQNGSYLASDPAKGDSIPISETLTGEVTWGKTKTKKYVPIAIIPIFKAA